MHVYDGLAGNGHSIREEAPLTSIEKRIDEAVDAIVPQSGTE